MLLQRKIPRAGATRLPVSLRSHALLLLVSLMLLQFSLVASPAAGQTSWGLAADTRSQFYFCDIERDRVWKLDRQAKLHVVLVHNHCHTLLLGYDGNVYGEDIGAESRRGEEGVSLWKLAPQGERSYVLPPTTMPDESLWIVRDPEGNTYAWKGSPERKRESQILKRTPHGSVSVLAGSDWGYADGPGSEARFGNVAGMAVGLDRTLYVVEEGNLRKVDPNGTVTTLERGLFSKVAGGLPGYGGLFNHHMGVAVDAQNNVYVVDYGKRRVIKRTPSGVVTTVAESKGIANALTSSQWGWAPTGIAAVGDAIYLLEDWPLPTVVADLVGSPRLRKIQPDGKSETVASVASTTLRVLVGGFVVGMAVLAFYWRRRRTQKAKRTL